MKPRVLQHVEKIRFKGGHRFCDSDHDYFTLLQHELRRAVVMGCRVSAPCGIIRTGCSTQVGRQRTRRREGAKADDADSDRSDERHLARRGRCGIDRNRRQAGQGARAVRIPSLQRKRARAAASGAGRSGEPAAARCAAGHPGRGRAGRDRRPRRSRRILHRAESHCQRRRRYRRLSRPDRAAPSGREADGADRRRDGAGQSDPSSGDA